MLHGRGTSRRGYSEIMGRWYIYLGESGPKGPLACRQRRESYEEHLAARKLVSYQLLAASIERIIC